MNRFKLKLSEKGQAGQTMVEYILVMAMVVAVMLSMFEKLEEILLTGPNSFQNRFLGQYENIFSGGEGTENTRYRRFRVLK